MKIKIKSIKILNPKLLKDYIEGKERTLDYLVETDESIINVEINNYSKRESWVMKRDLLYACKVLTNYINKGEDYKNIKKVIQINLGRFGSDNPSIVSYKLSSTNKMKGVNDSFKELIEIELVNVDFYKKMVYNDNKKFILENEQMCLIDLTPEEITKYMEGEYIMSYKEDLEKINNNEDFVKWISAEKEARMIQNSIKLTAIEEGFEQGIEQGIEQGEKNKQNEIAKNMLKKGMDISIICELTNLTKEEIEKLKE